MKKIAILGSTGSIGTQALEVIAAHPNDFQVVAVTADSNIDLLEKQIRQFRPRLAAMTNPNAAAELTHRLSGLVPVFSGKNGLIELIGETDADIVLTSIVGAAGIEPTIAAIQAKKTIALANKETLVAAGELIMPMAKEKGVAILPVDSEHSAIFQCLEGQRSENVSKLIVTASGGPHFNRDLAEFSQITVEQCLRHPTWSMGNKITIDSATMFNKGLEVIEAHWLFTMPYDQIEIVIQPQSIIHSMIQLKDGSVLAQLGMPDMRPPIQYAFSYPKRLSHDVGQAINWKDLRSIDFFAPDLAKFPSIQYAYEAGREGGTMPCVLNGANEVAVEAFLRKRISFTRIYEIVKKTMDHHKAMPADSLETIQRADHWARHYAQSLL